MTEFDGFRAILWLTA